MDLRMKSPSSLLKNRGGKRGRPKKNAIRPPILANKSIPEEDLDDGKVLFTYFSDDVSTSMKS
jgi:hypothetical protein